MAVEHSKNMLVRIGDGLSPQHWNNLGTQSNGGLSFTGNRIDTTNKTTGNYATGIAGLRNFVVTADGFCNWPDTLGLAKLITYAVNGTDFNTHVQLNSFHDTWSATVQATQLEINGPSQQATQWRTQLELSQGVPVTLGSPGP
jgi:hypothetical protein